MNLIDIICAAVIILIAFFGVIKGFFSVLINLAAYLVSFLTAKLASAPLAGFLYGSYVRSGVMTKLNELLPEGSVSGGLAQAAETFLNSMPDNLARFIRYFHLQELVSGIDGGREVLSVAEIEGSYVSPILTKVLTILTFFGIFLVLSVILRVIAGFTDKALFKKKKGLMSTTNKILGGIFGLIKGLVPAGLVCFLLNLLAPIVHNDGFTELVSGSRLCALVARLIS